MMALMVVYEAAGEDVKVQMLSHVEDMSIVQPDNKNKDKVCEPIEEDEGILGMFDEDGPSDQSLPDSVVQIQKREKITAWGSYGDAPSTKKATSTKKGSKSVPQVVPAPYSANPCIHTVLFLYKYIICKLIKSCFWSCGIISA